MRSRLGRPDDDQVSAAVERVNALMPRSGDAAHPDYWVIGAFSLMEYALECARRGSQDPANWVCGAALNLPANIDYRVDKGAWPLG